MVGREVGRVILSAAKSDASDGARLPRAVGCGGLFFVPEGSPQALGRIGTCEGVNWWEGVLGAAVRVCDI